MRSGGQKTRFITGILVAALLIGLSSMSSWAQAPPPNFPPDQLDKMVSRIALYPDPLLAQILAAATFPDQIPDAAKYADEHHYLTGDALAKAISDDHLPWDPSVQALIPFPSVLEMMSGDMSWTTDLGNAVLAQHQDVMDAVQRMRQKAKDYGYLQTNSRIRVVFGVTRFDWGGHVLFLNDRPWGRTWVNRGAYVHPYPGLQHWQPNARVEGHALTPRSPREREGARMGRPRIEEHGRR